MFVETLTVEENGETVSHLQLAIIDGDNPKHSCRPYAVIENVRTEAGFENRGFATELLNRAIEIACENGCYKVFLATSSTDAAAHHLYSKVGFSADEKVCYNLRLGE